MRINSLLAAALCAAGAVTSQSALAATLQPDSSSAQAVVTAAAPKDVVEFGIYLPLRHQDKLETLVAQLHDKTSSQYHQWLQPEEFLAQFGPRPADIAAVATALSARGLTIVSTDAHGLRVSGTADAVAQALATPIQKVRKGTNVRFKAGRAPQLPSELATIDMHVVGLDGLPSRKVHSRNVTAKPAATAAGVDSRYGSPTGPYWYDDLKQAYDYPAYSANTDGSGVSVAILMADLIFPNDVPQMFNHELWTQTTGKPVPDVANTVLIKGGGTYGGYGSEEASLDVQMVLGGAPGSKVTLVSLPDLSDDNILRGYEKIVDSNKYDIVSSSFGGCELFYTADYNGGTDFTYLLKAQHDLFMQGNAQGITFIASSGDEAGLECPDVNYINGGTGVYVPSVSTPADDPAVTAVGGGNLVTTDDGNTTALRSKYVRESAFSDPETLGNPDPYGTGGTVTGGRWGAGGGVSVVFKKPRYQDLAKTGGGKWRTIPDIGMQVGGCPGSVELALCSPDDSAAVIVYGYGIGGGNAALIGTSVSAPEFAGALAVYEQQFGKKNHRMGNLNWFLYEQGALQTAAGGVNAPNAFQFYHRNIPGYNGVVSDSFPSYNYNYTYGNGSPDVRRLFGMTDYKAAGDSRTPSNP